MVLMEKARIGELDCPRVEWLYSTYLGRLLHVAFNDGTRLSYNIDFGMNLHINNDRSQKVLVGE
jgi:hypothetical protein